MQNPKSISSYNNNPFNHLSFRFVTSSYSALKKDIVPFFKKKVGEIQSFVAFNKTSNCYICKLTSFFMNPCIF